MIEKILDFVARRLETPNYMEPEKYLSPPWCSPEQTNFALMFVKRNVLRETDLLFKEEPLTRLAKRLDPFFILPFLALATFYYYLAKKAYRSRNYTELLEAGVI